ncbi:MAG: hypothetical protein MK085_08420 [Phycisphaerales bacterium]|nr:hypothetical protein [Phycisphaerales bacterium]
MFVVDSSVLAIAADRSDTAHDACRLQLEAWRRQPTPWYLTWPILFDFLRIVTHPGIYRQPWRIEQAWAYVDAIIAAPTLSVLSAGDAHQSIVAQLLEELPDLRGEVMHETQIAATMLEHGVKRIVTRDVAFNRFPMLEVVDPLRATA